MPNADNSKITLIRRKIYIVDDLSAKALISIDIIKPEDIILDINKDLITISSCESLQVPISTVVKEPHTDTTVLNKARHAMPAHSFITVPIKPVELPQDRDLIFEPDQLDTLTLSAHIINHNLTRIIVHNDTNLPITLSRHLRLNKILEYEAEGYFQIDPRNAPIAKKSLKKGRTKL